MQGVNSKPLIYCRFLSKENKFILF